VVDLLGGFGEILGWVSLALVLFAVFTFVDALVRPAEGYVAAGKLTKATWLVILGVSTVALFLFGFMHLLGLPAVVAVLVYLVDVRPAVRNATGGSGGSVGPYGPW